MSEKKLAGIALIATIIIWAGYAVVARNIVQIFPPFAVLFIRMGIGSLCFFPFLLSFKPWKKKSFKKIVLTSLFATINVSFYIIGVKFTSASASQLIYAAIPILIIFSGHLFRSEKYSSHKWVGVVVGLMGLFFIMYRSSIEKGTTITGTLFGNVLISIAMVGWMIWIIKSKSFSKEFAPVEIAGISCFVSFCVSAVLALLEIIITKPSFSFTPNILFSGLYLGAGGTFLTYILYQYAISKVSSFSASLTSYLQPVVTTLFASYFIGEKVNVSFFIGGLLVLLGVFVTQIHLVKHLKRS
ncbi:hypothetical protein A3D77_06050 [Candidatus Gottesmanbacteria bacterium RIFCSPHIGHO2_02_FULL_39_11]|uniref:EamA domain-containing protein n=1 Tax=Candidatus Gottesmanbacteria bacterium RIFCSPHIGHO2_02_FULL_39_11 TaxID=1798382 RepID=A0A1F5ZWT3_9BACT|nr:MAG: hypothetical protein A3D77_06050 [Candidatus Gottesmanbacteria bacterium RIFCSPHIGHO2_02_FULL_39_11]